MPGRRSVLTLLLAIGGLPGCGCHSPGAGPAPSASTRVRPPETVLVFTFGSEKKTWLDEAVRSFNESARSTASGKHIRIDGRPMGSGEAVQAIRAGTLRPHVFCPASGAYIALLNE